MSHNILIPFLCDLHEPDRDYEFHILSVWRDERTGHLYYAEDSGCSCPTPFEDYRFDPARPQDTNLSRLSKHDFDEFSRNVKKFPASYSDRQHFLDEVSKHLVDPFDIMKDMVK